MVKKNRRMVTGRQLVAFVTVAHALSDTSSENMIFPDKSEINLSSWSLILFTLESGLAGSSWASQVGPIHIYLIQLQRGWYNLKCLNPLNSIRANFELGKPPPLFFLIFRFHLTSAGLASLLLIQSGQNSPNIIRIGLIPVWSNFMSPYFHHTPFE